MSRVTISYRIVLIQCFVNISSIILDLFRSHLHRAAPRRDTCSLLVLIRTLTGLPPSVAVTPPVAHEVSQVMLSF